MAVQRTRWTAQYCRCVLVFQWNDEVPQAERVNMCISVEHACDEHRRPTMQGVLTAALDHDHRSNKAASQQRARG